MAGGWTRDGAVQDQIDDTVKDAVLRARRPHTSWMPWFLSGTERMRLPVAR